MTGFTTRNEFFDGPGNGRGEPFRRRIGCSEFCDRLPGRRRFELCDVFRRHSRGGMWDCADILSSNSLWASLARMANLFYDRTGIRKTALRSTAVQMASSRFASASFDAWQAAVMVYAVATFSALIDSMRHSCMSMSASAFMGSASFSCGPACFLQRAQSEGPSNI